MHPLDHIIVVNENPTLRARLRRATTATHPHASVTITDNSQRGLLAYHQRGADLLIIGSSTLMHGGQTLIQAVKRQHEHTPILVLCDDQVTYQDALAAGVTSIVEATVPYQQLLKLLVDLLPRNKQSDVQVQAEGRSTPTWRHNGYITAT